MIFLGIFPNPDLYAQSYHVGLHLFSPTYALENPLWLEILKGAIAEGDRVSAEVEDDKLVFRTG